MMFDKPLLISFWLDDFIGIVSGFCAFNSFDADRVNY